MLLADQVGEYYPTCSTSVPCRRCRWCISASRPTPSRSGTSPTRSATSRTTARSTPCAATSTGCARAEGRAFAAARRRPQKIWPLIYPKSDSASFDNALELLGDGGYSLAHAMMMMIPEAGRNPPMDEAPRLLRVPRGDDGALGRPRGGGLHRRPPDRRHLDRNGLRPARYLSPTTTSRGDGLRNPACCRPRTARSSKVAPAARQDVPDRHGAGPHHRRPGDQGALAHQSPTPTGCADPHQARHPGRPAVLRHRRRRRARRAAARSPAGLRLHAGGHQVHPPSRWAEGR